MFLVPAQKRAFSHLAVAHPQDSRHIVVRDIEHFWRVIRWLLQQPRVAVDTETSGLAWHRHARACGVSMAAWHNGAPMCFYFPMRHATGEPQLPVDVVVRGVRLVCQDTRITKIGHNLKFDEHILRRDDIRIFGPRVDTSIAGYLWNENDDKALKHRAWTDLGDPRAHEFEEVLSREVKALAKASRMGKEAYLDAVGYSHMPVEICGVYAAWDVDFTLRLDDFYIAKKDIPGQFPRVWGVEMELTKVLHDVEERGIPLDTEYLKWLAKQTEDYCDAMRTSLRQRVSSLCAGFDVSKDEHLRHLFYRVFRLPVFKTTDAGLPSVDAESLSAFSAERLYGGQVADIAKSVLDFKDAAKIRSTYTWSLIDRVGDDGCLRSDHQQVGTNTGRLASREPNFQNFSGDSNDRALRFSGKSLEDGGVDPWSVKRAFLVRWRQARLHFDYSQIELRVLARYSDDPVMVRAYLEGEDIHTRTSLEVFGSKEKAMRRLAKVINFGLSYCMSAAGFSRQAGIPLDEADRHLTKFFEKYSGVSKFRYALWDYARLNRCEFANIWGQRRRVPALNAAEGWMRGRAERQTIGSCIQGTAAFLTKESMVRIWQWEQKNSSGLALTGTIHDEINLDTPLENAREVHREVRIMMEDFPELEPVPVETDAEITTTTWQDKHKVPKEWGDDVPSRREDCARRFGGKYQIKQLTA